MRLTDIVCGPWAITPEMLLEIQGIYATHVRGEKINIPDIEAKLGRKLDNRYESFQVVDGVAIIPVDGVIAKRMNLFSQISGGASTELIKRDIEQALNDPAIKGIILNVDSPGGTVDGTSELADFIYNSRDRKPIVAFSDGMVASAAYWIASSAESLYISGDTNMIGSIGVVAAHRDLSKREEQYGVKTTEITAGKYKRIASQYAPLTEEGQADIQGKVDYLYAAFVGDVARNRGTSVEDVLSRMADGRVFTGKQSISAGLVDGVSTLDDLIDQLQKPQQGTKTAAAGVVAGKPTAKEQIMDLEKLKADHPDLVAQIEAAAREGMVVVATVTEERGRICALVSAAFGEEPGKKFAAVVEKGLTAEDIQSFGITFGGNESSTADIESRKEILDGLKESGTKPLGKINGDASDKKDFETLVGEYQTDKGCGKSEAIKAIAKAHPEAHAAYIKKTNAARA
jgi:signal peptide peptidase SppA